MSRKKLHQSEILLLPDKTINLLSDIHLCPACMAKDKGSLVYSFGAFKVVRCTECQTFHLDPLPNQKGLYQLYNHNYFADPREMHGYLNYRKIEAIIKKNYRRRLNKVRKIINQHIPVRRIHEIGCALGYGMEVAQQIFNAYVTGSDISEEALQECRGKGYVCYKSNIEGRCGIPDNESVDLVIAFDVIEHIENIPLFDSWLSRITSENALIAVSTPDVDSLINRILGKRSPIYKIPQHVSYFTTKTLIRALKSFKMLSKWPDTQYIPLGRLIERFKHTVGMEHRKISNLDDLSLLVPNGMKIYVFAKRV